MLALPIVLLGIYVNALYIPQVFLPSHCDGNWSLTDYQYELKIIEQHSVTDGNYDSHMDIYSS